MWTDLKVFRYHSPCRCYVWIANAWSYIYFPVLFNSKDLFNFRDILQTLVSSVKDCTAEVKGVVVMVNETLQDGTLKSEEKLREYLERSKIICILL